MFAHIFTHLLITFLAALVCANFVDELFFYPRTWVITKAIIIILTLSIAISQIFILSVELERVVPEQKKVYFKTA